VVRLLTAKLDVFRAEEEAVFSAGLRASPFVSVDDTGARHAGKACFTTQLGSDRFTAFRTGPSKSRLAFLRNLLGGTARYAINAAAAAYMRAANLAHDVIDALMSADVVEFGSEADWRAHLRALGLTELRVAPDPVRVASEAAAHGARSAPRIGSGAPSSPGQARGLPTTPDSSASATTRSAGSTPSASSISSFPPTTGSATQSRSPG
jgi:hypothetical protein